LVYSSSVKSSANSCASSTGNQNNVKSLHILCSYKSLDKRHYPVPCDIWVKVKVRRCHVIVPKVPFICQHPQRLIKVLFSILHQRFLPFYSRCKIIFCRVVKAIQKNTLKLVKNRGLSIFLFHIIFLLPLVLDWQNHDPFDFFYPLLMINLLTHLLRLCN